MSISLSTDAAWRRLHEEATAPYRQSGRFGWHFAFLGRGCWCGDICTTVLAENSFVAAYARHEIA